jgi:enoyl-CoA hydratase/carnithine racemase
VSELVSDRAVVLREQHGGVLLLTFNRPERLNAWTLDMEERYFDLLADAAHDPAVRAVVVTGAGRGFCAGLDADALAGVAAGTPVSARPRRPQTFPQQIPKPIVAAVNGPAAGIGFLQALVADVRFAAAGAKFTTAFTRRGLLAEHGMSWLLPRLIGTSRATELLLSARVFLAEEAAELGLVHRVVPADALLDTALDYARELAEQCSPLAMGLVKHQVAHHWDVDLDEARRETAELVERLHETADFEEGVRSFVEKRPPRFEPLTTGPGLPPPIP